jgi:hypothetical protein
MKTSKNEKTKKQNEECLLTQEGKPLKVMEVRHFIEVDDEVYEVLDPAEHKIKKNYAYFHGDYVYICAGKLKPEVSLLPGRVYINKDSKKKDDPEYIWVDPTSDEDKFTFAADRVNHFSPAALMYDVNDRSKFKAMIPVEVEKEEDLYSPKIKENDDIFKRIVKEVILRKKISLRQYRGKFKNDYDISNMRYALSKKDGPMSTKYFQKWAEVLDLDVDINVRFINGDGEEEVITQKLV